ncbi:MAG: DUF4326 domain-containing protein [Sulfuritalea sp.]|nr:DUF4326 domain-containing protein [Sulfuritalea sp.]
MTTDRTKTPTSGNHAFAKEWADEMRRGGSVSLNAPQRIQLSRKKGWHMPPGAVNCARPGKWGNPWPVGKDGPDGDRFDTAQACVDRYSMFIGTGGGMPTEADIRRELRGRDLACWCPLPKPGEPDVCHAAVLLEIANRQEQAT